MRFLKTASTPVFLLLLLIGVTPVTYAEGNKGYAWVLKEVVDYDIAAETEKYNRENEGLYHSKIDYSRGSYFEKQVYTGKSSNSSKPPKVQGEHLTVQAIWSPPPNVIEADDEVMLPISFITFSNTLSFFQFEKTTEAYFDAPDISPGSKSGGATMFTDSDGVSSFRLYHNNYEPIVKMLTAKPRTGSKEGDRMALFLTMGASASPVGTKFIYEWQAASELAIRAADKIASKSPSSNKATEDELGISVASEGDGDEDEVDSEMRVNDKLDSVSASSLMALTDEPANVLLRVLDAQARGDMVALEKEWDLDAVGPEAAHLHRSRLKAVAASLHFDEFEARPRVTMLSADGALATVRVEVSFLVSNAAGSARYENGVLGILRRTSAEAPWLVVGIVPDELLNDELMQRADEQELAALLWRYTGASHGKFLSASLTSSDLRSTARGVSVFQKTANLGPSKSFAEIQTVSQRFAEPISYAELNDLIDRAMISPDTDNMLEFRTKLAMALLSSGVGKIPGPGDAASLIYQGVDTAKDSMEVLAETMKNGFTRVGGLKALQVFAGCVQMVVEMVPVADSASDVFALNLKAITMVEEFRRDIYQIKRDLKSGKLKPSRPALRLVEGITYPPGVSVFLDDASEALLDPSKSYSFQDSYQRKLLRVNIVKPTLLVRKSPRLFFEAVAQVVIDTGWLGRYATLASGTAKILGAVQRGDNWVLPVLVGDRAAEDASTGAAVLANFQRVRALLKNGAIIPGVLKWGWQPCLGTQKVSVKFADESKTFPVTVRNSFLNRITSLAVHDAQGDLLKSITLSPGESVTDLQVMGIGPGNAKTNLTPLFQRPLPCAERRAPDGGIVDASLELRKFSITAANPGSTRLGLRITGDGSLPDLVLDFPIEVAECIGKKFHYESENETFDFILLAPEELFKETTRFIGHPPSKDQKETIFEHMKDNYLSKREHYRKILPAVCLEKIEHQHLFVVWDGEYQEAGEKLRVYKRGYQVNTADADKPKAASEGYSGYSGGTITIDPGNK